MNKPLALTIIGVLVLILGALMANNLVGLIGVLTLVAAAERAYNDHKARRNQQQTTNA